MNQLYTFAVYAADTLAGETLLQELGEHAELAILTLHPISITADTQASVQFQGESLDCVSAEDIGFSEVDFLLIPAGIPRPTELIMAALDAGCTIVDASIGAAIQDYTTPVMVGFNDFAIEEVIEQRYCTVPSSSIATLLPLLQKIDATIGIRCATITVMCSAAAAAGISGVNRLRTQTIELLNGQSVEKGESEHRLAYNLVPELTGSVADTNILQELALAVSDNAQINVTTVNTPVFFGEAFVLNIDVTQSVDLAMIADLLSSDTTIVAENAEVPSLEQAAGSAELHIGNIRQTATNGDGFSFWAVADSVKRSAMHVTDLTALLISELKTR